MSCERPAQSATTWFMLAGDSLQKDSDLQRDRKYMRIFRMLAAAQIFLQHGLLDSRCTVHAAGRQMPGDASGAQLSQQGTALAM